jgi:hypothetical protein
MTTTRTMTTPRTTPTILLRFTALAALCLTILVTTFQTQKVYAQNVDQLTKKQGTDFPANFLSVEHSDPVTIQVDVQDYLFTVSPGSQGTTLGYVEVGTTDSFAKDYSGLAGSNEFGFIYGDIIIMDVNGNSTSTSKPARIGILELKESPEGNFQVAVDRGKTSLCFPLGYETGEEELSKLVRLIRTKDGRLAAMVTFNDTEGILASVQPGISERICMVLPLLESDPAKSLKLVRDKEGNSFALLLLRDGNSRAKADGSGKANLGVTILTPTDKEMAQKMEMTLVVVN